MKKKVLSVLLASALAATMLVGCGGGGGDTQSKNPGNDSQQTPGGDDSQPAADDPIQKLIEATSGTVNIELWCSELEAYQTTMKQLVEDFKAAYPDVTFNITVGAVSESDAKDRALEDPEAAGDVFVFAGDQLNALVTAGALQPVSATYTYDPMETNGSAIVDAASMDGKLYAYPFTASNGYFLYYNANELSADDVSSWEKLLAAAEGKNKKVGMDMGNSWYIWGFFAGAGLPTTRDADDNTSCEWNNETGVKVATKMQDIASSSAFVSCGNTDATAMLPQGDLIAFIDGTWDETAFKDAYGDGYAAAKLPTFEIDGNAVQMASFAGYKFVGVNAYAENTGWSMLLAEFITSEASQKAIGEATGEGPANTNAAAGITSPALSALGEQAAFASLEINTVGGKYWDPATTLGKTLVEGGVTDMQKLLDDAVAGITQPAQ